MELCWPIFRKSEISVLDESLTTLADDLKIKVEVEYDSSIGRDAFGVYPPEVPMLGGIKVLVKESDSSDSLRVLRVINALMNERALPLQESAVAEVWRRFDEIFGNVIVLDVDSYVLNSGLWNSIRALKRALGSIWKTDRFIHLWRSFNALYSSLYQVDRKTDPRRTTQKRMFSHIIEKTLDEKQCSALVSSFLENHNLKWLQELKIDAMLHTREGYNELLRTGKIISVDGYQEDYPEGQEPWISSEKNWRSLLNIRQGLDFWDRYEEKKHIESLKELIGLIYDANRNKVFHGYEPLDEDPSFFDASLALLYDLDTLAILGVLDTVRT